jgi:hypothetical protein
MICLQIGGPRARTDGFPRNISQKIIVLRIATQRWTQAQLAYDSIAIFPPEHSLRNGFNGGVGVWRGGR